MSGYGRSELRHLHWIRRTPIRRGRIVAHNDVRPVDFRALCPPDVGGYRVWTDDILDRYVLSSAHG